MIVIGMGSGRSGTKSLAKMLDEQDHAKVTHEYGEPLHWDLNELHWQLWEDRLDKWKEKSNKYWESYADMGLNTDDVKGCLYGDVASWYLPYIEKSVRESGDSDFLQELDDGNYAYHIRVIVLKRDKDEVIESFDAWTGQGNRWQEKGGDWPEYDHAFPTYPDELSKREAIGQYWEDYHETCEWLEDVTDFVKVFDIDVLNSEEGQQKIFDFLGIDGEYVEVHENKRR